MVCTGGGSGIGRAIATLFARAGAAVVICGRDVSRLEVVADELNAEPGMVIPISADVTVEASVNGLFEEVDDRIGTVEVLINNAGAFGAGRIEELTLEAWHETMEVNVTGPFLCSREAFSRMKDNGGGRIINIGSISAMRPRAHSVPYTASKHALWGLTQALALEGRRHGITVSCVNLGATAVERNRARWPTTPGEGEPMMNIENAARTVLFMATLDKDVNMLEATVLPINQLYLGRG